MKPRQPGARRPGANSGRGTARLSTLEDEQVALIREPLIPERLFCYLEHLCLENIPTVATWMRWKNAC